METLFQGRDLSVLHQPGGDAETWVTFGALSCRTPTCAGYIGRRGATGLHVFSHADHWYQTPEMEAVLWLIARQRRGRLLTFGGSMGGHAALRLAAALEADVTIAVSPQSALPVPWDDRWEREWRPLEPVAVTSAPDAWILYDPFVREDRLHAEAVRDARHVRAWLCGHEIMEALKEAGAYADALTAMIDGRRPDLTPLRRTREVRSNYWLALGRTARQHRRPELSRYALDRALASEPTSLTRSYIHYQRNLLFSSQGDIEGARDAVRRCMIDFPHWSLHHRLAHLYACAGDIRTAESIFLEGLSMFPGHIELTREFLRFYRTLDVDISPAGGR